MQKTFGEFFNNFQDLIKMDDKVADEILNKVNAVAYVEKREADIAKDKEKYEEIQR